MTPIEHQPTVADPLAVLDAIEAAHHASLRHHDRRWDLQERLQRETRAAREADVA